MEWAKLLYVIGAIVLIALTIWYIRSNPKMFSKENLNRSFFTMGILALILIAFLAVVILLLRSS